MASKDSSICKAKLRRRSGVPVTASTRLPKTSSPNFILSGISLLVLYISTVSGTITVFSKASNESVVVFEDAPASFVPDRVSSYGMQGYAKYSDPANACTTVDPPPSTPPEVNWILVARRFDCDFQTKIENAQSAGYAAIIVHNVGSNNTAAMGADHPSSLFIYACFVGEYNGELLRDRYAYIKNPDYVIRIHDDFSMNGYLLPFAIVVGVCFIVMLIFMLWQQVVRCLAERRRSRRRKLPSSALKKLPITKWTKGDPYETCAICLEDFVEQDKVRVLPCSHGFHGVCIDPWLTKGRRVCPVCKRKVILADERFPHSDSDTDDEAAPLLGAPSTSTAQNPASSDSTFVQRSLENPQTRRYRGLRGFRGQIQQGQPPTSDSDSQSSTGSENSTGRLTSHSLPVLAQVHSVEVEPGIATASSARFPRTTIFNNDGASNSQFYVSCEDDPEDEEMLDLSEHIPVAVGVEADPDVLILDLSTDATIDSNSTTTNAIV